MIGQSDSEPINTATQGNRLLLILVWYVKSLPAKKEAGEYTRRFCHGTNRPVAIGVAKEKRAAGTRNTP